MTTSIQPDSLFQICITHYHEAFGIDNPEELETQKREIVPESVNVDAAVLFPADFDFTTLSDRIFPFLGRYNVFEYKGQQDRLSLMSFCQYILTELGLITTHLLSKEREDRAERTSLSMKAATAQWQQLQKQGAKHSCCVVILSTITPKGLRKNFSFEPVDTYEHLSGALYRLVLFENELVGSLVTYIVVINDLPIHPKNAPLLLLSTGEKLEEFLDWLLESHEEITILQRESYLSHLVKYNLVGNNEVLEKMSKKRRSVEENVKSFILELSETLPDEQRLLVAQATLLAHSPIEAAQRVLRANSPMEVAQRALQADSPMEIAQRALQADSPMEIAQRALQADSPMEIAQRALQADSPMEIAQRALQTDSPAEAAFRLIQNEEQMEQLLEMIRQRNLEQSENLDKDQEESTIL